MRIIVLLSFLSSLCIANYAYSVDHYWIGGTGNWSAITSWSATSGGAAGTTIPTATDNAIFDNNSGLASNADIVTLDGTVTMDSLILSAVPNSFTMNSVLASIDVNGSIVGNAFGLNFTWVGGIINMLTTIPESITSGAIIWEQGFVINGAGGSVTLLDNLNIGGNTFSTIQGSFLANGTTLTCGDFTSTGTLVRSIDIINSIVNCNGASWQITTPANLTWLYAPSTINISSPVPAMTFSGGSLMYDTIRSTTPQLSFIANNTVQLFDSQNSFRINNNDTLYVDSLRIASACLTPLTIESVNPLGVSAYIQKIGFPTLSQSYLLINNVDAVTVGPEIYNLSASDTINGADGWNIISQDYYWINGTGNWSDTIQWSLTSGGPNTSCIPTVNDNVFFDANSGLASVADVVTFDIPFAIHNFNFQGVLNPFAFAGAVASVEIQGDLIANGSANFTYTGDINLNPYAAINVSSIGQQYDNNINVMGTDTVLFVDDFNTLRNINLSQGNLVAENIQVDCFDFYSDSINTRIFNIDSTLFNLAGTVWRIDSTGLVFSDIPSRINLNNIGVVSFTGGHQAYDTIKSFTTEIQLFSNNSIRLLELDSSNLTLDNGSLQQIDSLISFGDCTNKTIIQSLNPALASAQIQKTGFNIYTGVGLSINNVDALFTSNEEYHIVSSDTTNGADGWLYKGANFYWIADGGNWSDGNQWSLSSGGLPAGCVPRRPDTVYFDLLSFTLAGQVVLVDSVAEFSKMDWTSTAFASTLDLDTNVISYGDVTFYPSLLVTRGVLNHNFSFRQQAVLDPDSSYIDCSIGVNMTSVTDSLLLIDYLEMSDSSGIVLRSGEFYSQNNNIITGDIYVLNDPASGSDARKLDLGSSTVDLFSSFNSETDTTFTFFAGTSVINIGDTLGKQNSLKTQGLSFNEVNLDFSELTTNFPTAGTPVIQEVKGNNAFNKLRVAKASHVYFMSGSTQTINDSLIMVGNCRDSIFIFSSDTAAFTAANFNSVAASQLECVNYSGMTNTGVTLTTYFSTDVTSNTNWTFDTTAPVVAGFTADGPFCFGDTTLFTNTSVAFSGNSADFTSQWYYNDTTTGYFLNPPTDSTWINYEVDTLQHVFAVAGDIYVDLVTIYANFCTDTITDTVHINNPQMALISSEAPAIICLGDSVAFSAISLSSGLDFQFFLNGTAINAIPSPNDTLYTTDTLANGDVVGLLAYENGCVADSMDTIQYTVNVLPVITWFSSDVDTSICATDSVYFSAFGGDTYQYNINGTPISGFLTDSSYSTNSFIDNDSVSVTVRIDSTQCLNETPPMVFEVLPLPTTSLASSIVTTNICDGTSVTFTGSGANTYEFFINGVSQGAASAITTLTTTTLVSTDTVRVMGYNTLGGCSFMAPQSYTFIVDGLPNTILNFTDADTSICSNTSTVFTASGASLYEFFVNGVSVQGPIPTTTYTTTALANNDSVYVIGGFSGCSGYSDTAIFEVLTAPTTTLISDDADSVICAGTNVTFTSTGATTYEFYIDGASQGAASATNTFSTTNLTNGQVVSVIGESNTCTVSQAIPFTVLALPSVSLFSDDPDNTICQGDVITFTGANAALYELFVNSTSQGTPQVSPTFTPALPTGVDTVYIIGTAANGCSDTSATVLNITVNAIPTITLTSSDADDIICEGESVTFTGTGSAQYQFLINGITQGSMSATNTLTTTNLLNTDIVTINGSTFGCLGSSNAIAMTVFAVPAVTLTSTDVDNVFCVGDPVTFTGAGATNYEFFVDGVSQGAPSPTNTINSAGFIAGNYPVLVIGESNNCFGTNSSNVTVNDVPTVVFTSSDIDNIICEGESVSYTATGGVSYEFFINGVSQGAASPVNVFTSSTLINNDVISVTVNSASFCSSNAAMLPISVIPTPIVTLANSDADTTICSGTSVTFTGAGATDYEFFVNGVSQGPSSPTNTFATTTIANTDSVGVIGTMNGCVATSNGFTFTVNNAPLVLFANNGASTICTAENTNMVATGANNYEFFVNGVSTGASSPVNTFTNPVNNGDVVSVIGESNGCTSPGDFTYAFTVNTFPTLVTTSSDANNEICLDEQVDFTASGATTYLYTLNGDTLQNGTTSIYGLNTLANGDVIAITGFNGPCASAIDSYTFVVNSMTLNMTIAPSSMICSGDAVTFTATGADEYEFFLNGTSTGAQSPTNTYTSSTLNNLDQVTFTGYSNTTLCLQDNADFITMNVIATPLITPLSSTTFCDGDSVQLTSNAPYGNQWVLDGAPIAGATDTIYTALVGGSYTLEKMSGGLGTLWSFGQNATGTFANGNNFNNSEPTPANNAVMFDEISSGADFILAVSTTGDAYSWGENSSGQLGDGTYTNTNLPNLVPTLTGVKTVATTESSSMAVLTTGDVYVWGNNTQGQLATGNTAVVNFPMLNAAVANTDSIAGGKSHFVILRNDGTVWAVGNNDFGQLGQGNLTSSMNPVQVAGLANIVSVGAGEYHSFAIDNLGDLYVWGNNGSGQLGLSDLGNRLAPTLSPVANVINAQGGATHSVFLTSDNKVFTSGDNSYGQLGTGNFTATTEAVQVPISGADMISAGQYTTLVKKTDRSVFGFGNNTEDQLSSTTGNLVNSPEHISDLNGVGFIEAGKSASHVLYQEDQQCVSAAVNVTVNAVPAVTVTLNIDTLTTVAGVSYQWFFNGALIPGATNQTYIANETGNFTVQVTFANGCVGTSADTFVSFVGLEDITLGTVKVYPNPTSNILYITFEKEMSGLTSIYVLDQTGRIVLENTMNAQLNYSVDVNSLVDGVYFVKVENEGRELIMKFIKAKN
ncbi:MAG: T9SS type A sorting domain-containing protein [Fluviicola sp.]|nr:T9SS type A sorting domain-containing protein [Fluviicola sp.]